jgi:hypothetical protein
LLKKVQELNETSEKLKSNENDSKNNANFLQKWEAISKVCEADMNKQILGDNKTSLSKIVEELNVYLAKTKSLQTDIDIKSQQDLISKWQKEQEKELNEQIRNFTIESKKKNILQQLSDLEKQEEVLTFFDRSQEIADFYYNKGFTIESPSKIPIEPDEAIFAAKAERHFKPWPKYANKPKWYGRISHNKQLLNESLKKIYLTPHSHQQLNQNQNSKNESPSSK